MTDTYARLHLLPRILPNTRQPLGKCPQSSMMQITYAPQGFGGIIKFRLHNAVRLESMASSSAVQVRQMLAWNARKDTTATRVAHVILVVCAHLGTTVHVELSERANFRVLPVNTPQITAQPALLRATYVLPAVSVLLGVSTSARRAVAASTVHQEPRIWSAATLVRTAETDWD